MKNKEICRNIRIFLLNYDTYLENELIQINNNISKHKKVSIDDILLQYKYLCFRECFAKVSYDLDLLLHSFERGGRL